MNRIGPALLLMTLGLSASAESVGGISVPEHRGTLQLQGAGVLRKGLIFKVYVGALYIENTNHVERILTDVPKRLDIHYFHNTPKKYMIQAADDVLQNNLTAQQYTELQPKIGQLHDAYLDGKKDSCASLIYRPGEGLTYTFDNKSVITIPGDDFANAYFSVWLGEQPSSRTMKRALLNHE